MSTSRTVPEDTDAPVEPGTFLEKRSYRRRRLVDGLRLLPLLGIWLFMVPLFWPAPEGGPTAQSVSMSGALTYVFGVWIALIVLSGVLVGLHTKMSAGSDTTDEGP